MPDKHKLEPYHSTCFQKPNGHQFGWSVGQDLADDDADSGGAFDIGTCAAIA